MLVLITVYFKYSSNKENKKGCCSKLRFCMGTVCVVNTISLAFSRRGRALGDGVRLNDLLFLSPPQFLPAVSGAPVRGQVRVSYIIIISKNLKDKSLKFHLRVLWRVGVTSIYRPNQSLKVSATAMMSTTKIS